MHDLFYRRMVRASLLLGICLGAGAGNAGQAQDAEEGALGLILDQPVIAMGGQDICQGDYRPGEMMAPPPRSGGGPGPFLGFGPGFGPGPGSPPPGGFLMFAIGELDLTDEQLEKIESIKNTTRDRADLVLIKLHALERDFYKALTEPAINSEAVSRVQGEIVLQKQALDAIFSESIVAVAHMLTPEQRKQLRQQQLRSGLVPLVVKITQQKVQNDKVRGSGLP